MGMSNLAALQGADSATGSSCQTSQAASGEYFRLMDWNSLRNVGMAGERFKKAQSFAEKDGVDVDALIAKSGHLKSPFARVANYRTNVGDFVYADGRYG